MKLVLIADTHEQHDKVVVPPCDVLIHAGDLTGRGSPTRTDAALAWLDKQPAKHVIFIAGNHDFFFQKYPAIACDLLQNRRVIYLENAGIEIDGVKFWGSPYTPEFLDWAFMYNRALGAQQWAQIPSDTNVLITHGPPYGILDTSVAGGPKLGCSDLGRAVQRLARLKLHVFGHIHGGHGHEASSVHEFYNASVVDEAYHVVHKPFEVEI